MAHTAPYSALGRPTQSRAERYRSAAIRYRNDAKKWRDLMWRTPILTKARRRYEKKANEAARKAKEQMRLYRQAKLEATRAANAARKDARQPGGAVRRSDRGAPPPPPGADAATDAEDEALDAEIEAAGGSVPEEGVPRTWLYVGAGAAVLGLALVLSRRSQ